MLKYTAHAKEQMRLRSIPRRAVELVYQFGDEIPGYPDNFCLSPRACEELRGDFIEAGLQFERMEQLVIVVECDWDGQDFLKTAFWAGVE